VDPQSSESSLESRGKSVSFREELQTGIGVETSSSLMSIRQPPSAARFGALKSALRMSKAALHGGHQRQVAAA